MPGQRVLAAALLAACALLLEASAVRCDEGAAAVEPGAAVGIALPSQSEQQPALWARPDPSSNEDSREPGRGEEEEKEAAEGRGAGDWWRQLAAAVAAGAPQWRPAQQARPSVAVKETVLSLDLKLSQENAGQASAILVDALLPRRAAAAAAVAAAAEQRQAWAALQQLLAAALGGRASGGGGRASGLVLTVEVKRLRRAGPWGQETEDGAREQGGPLTGWAGPVLEGPADGAWGAPPPRGAPASSEAALSAAFLASAAVASIAAAAWLVAGA
eukprot:scaffold19.g1772.t1